MKGHHLGELEELVLLAVCSLGDDAYGVTVQQQIEKVAGRSATLGAVYSALERLERKDCVSSWIGGATDAPGGRRKRYFGVTPSGRQRVEASRAARDSMWAAVEARDV